ncbi:hypothetical protein LIER_04315 [Lithospermum erythrorhizon]|uniref:Aminotransferase-like plant mobile domain-containing protein n=1 Tax=Lithospermum erythrorhizon TaxID=34254 RepID=A0AAV3P105_LITER
MDVGKMVSLAIPVLSSIYRGLHLITTARYPTNSGSCFPVHYLLAWIGTYLRVYSPMKKYPTGPYMALFGGIDSHLSLSLSGAYQFLDDRAPYWTAIRPSRPSSKLFTDDQLDSEEDMAFLLSLRTNMVGYREDSFFLLEAYNPHRFSKQLGFSPAVPGFKSRSRDTVLASKGLNFGDPILPTGKSTPRLPSSMVSLSSKPLKRWSPPKDDSVGIDPKHAKWGTTRRAETVLSSKARTEIVDSDESSDCMVTEVADSGDDALEIMDSTGPLDCMITEAAVTGSSGNGAQTGVVDVDEPSDCVITMAVDAVVAAAFLFTGIQRIESILRDRLRVSWSEDCSFVEASGESSFKLQHETEAIGSVRTTLHQFEEKAARLRQELADLDTNVEDLRGQVAVRESMITGLESEQAKLPLETTSLEESIERGRESRVEQLGIA